MKYKLPQKLKDHLKGFKYQYDRIQDNLFKVYVDIEKKYLPLDFKREFMDNATVWVKDDQFNTLRVTFYIDFEKVL